MNVLHVLNGAIGGASLSTLALIEGLGKLGVHSFIYCSSRSSPEARADLQRRSPVPVFFGPLYFWNKRDRKNPLLRPMIQAYQLMHTGFLYRSSTRLATLCRQLGVDLVHSSTALAPDGAIAARRLGLPHVWHIREMLGPGQLHRLAGDERGMAARRFLRTGYVVANSVAAFRSFFKADFVEGASVIHNGFDFSPFDHEFEAPLSSRQVRFGLVSNLSSTWKRHETFIRAASIVARKLPQARFCIYGEVPTPPHPYSEGLLKLCGELHLEGILKFAGYRRDIAEVMAEIDIVVHAAEHESFGRVFVEASAAGRGLIAVRGGASEEVIEDGVTGVLVAPHSPEAMAQAMLDMVADPDRARSLGARARVHVREHFDIRRSCERMLSIYQRQQATQSSAAGFARSLVDVMG